MPLIKKEQLHLGTQAVHTWRLAENFVADNGAAADAPPDVQPSRNSEAEFAAYKEEHERKLQEIVAQGNIQAGEIKTAAEAEAQRILEAAQEEAQKKAQEILDAERAKGIDLGKKEVFEQFKGLLQEGQNIIKQANAQKNTIIKSAIPEILKLTTRIAAQVIHNELTQSPDVVLGIVKDAIEKISDNEQVVIKVSPQDLQNVRKEKELLIDLVEAKNLSIVPDKHCAEGGCYIETKLGFIDARVVTKLDMIQNALLAVYKDEKNKRETILKEKLERGEEADAAAEEQKEIDELMQETSLEEIREQENKMPEDLPEEEQDAQITAADDNQNNLPDV